MLQGSQVPCLRWLLFWVPGMALGYAFPGAEMISASLVVIGILLYCMVRLWEKRTRCKAGSSLSGALFFTWSAIAWLWTSVRVQPLLLSGDFDYNGTIQVQSYCGESAKNHKFIVQPVPDTGNNWLLFWPKSRESQPVPGDFITGLWHPKKPDPPALPTAFDYERYLNSRGISHMVFARIHQGEIQKSPAFSWYRWLFHTRRYVAERIKNDFGTGKQAALVQAILLGDKTDLDSVTRHRFSDLGVAHFLAVSGLHVGIVYILLLYMLGAFRKRRGRLKWRSFLVLLSGIWIYALLSGVQPSVVRASAMFTFLSLRRVLGRRVHPLNLWAAAALLLLMVQPHLALHLGFYLSFMAVAGIVIGFQALQSLWHPSGKALNALWDALCVSICAQLATLPLSLFIFQRFPIYFLPANLWVNLFSFPIVGLSFVYLLAGWIPLLGPLLIGMITNLLYLLLWGMRQMARFGNLVWYLQIDLWDAGLLTGYLLLLGGWLIWGGRLVPGTGLLLAVIFIYSRYCEGSEHTRVEVYARKNQWCALVIEKDSIHALQLPYSLNFVNDYHWQGWINRYPERVCIVPQFQLKQRLHKNEGTCEALICGNNTVVLSNALPVSWAPDSSNFTIFASHNPDLKLLSSACARIYVRRGSCITMTDDLENTAGCRTKVSVNL